MTYLGINHQRFSYLLMNGLKPENVKQFFKECQIQLIACGGKVQNLPSDYQKAIKMLSSGLPSPTDKVVKSWFIKHIIITDKEDADFIVTVYRKYEEINKSLPAKIESKFATSCLAYLFSDNPPESILDFLRSPIIAERKLPKSTVQKITNNTNNADHENGFKSFSEILESLADRVDNNQVLEGIPQEIANYISGLQEAAKGQIQEAITFLNFLPTNSKLHHCLSKILSEYEAQKPIVTHSSTGILVTVPEIFKEEFDYDYDEILAKCIMAERATAVFVNPIAVFRKNKIYSLSDEMKLLFFPERGNLISFDGQAYPPQPHLGELGVWKVSRHSNGKTTHYHISKTRKITVYEVIAVPFNSKEHDSVREYIKNASGKNSCNPSVFYLKDNYILASRNEHTDLTRDENYESGLLLWDSLPAVKVDGRDFVIGPLPKEQRIYECATLNSTIRKLFKFHVGANGGISKEQLRFLAQSLSNSESEIDSFRIERVRLHLESLIKQDETFTVLIEEIMSQPDINQRIDNLVNAEVVRQLDQKRELYSDVDNLRKEAVEWKERIKKQNDEYRKIPENIKKSIRTAFEKACADGLTILGEYAVFKSILDSNEVARIAKTDLFDSPSLKPSPLVRDLVSENNDPILCLQTLGISRRQATAFKLVAEIAHRAGLMVCVRGITARPAVEIWTKSIAQHGVLIDSTIGIIHDSLIRGILEKETIPDVLTLLDANLSALDIYARALTDHVFKRFGEPASEQQPAIFLTLTNGIGGLPLPTTFERLSICIDLDIHYEIMDAADLDEIFTELSDPDDGILYKRFWRPAANALLKQLKTLGQDQQILVLSLLKVDY